MRKSKSARRSAPPFAYEGLDRVMHERARLSVLTSLAAHPEGLPFGDLKQLCGLTDGNLSRHLDVLELACLIKIQKGVEHNRPLTVCRLTAAGRKRFVAYLGVLEQVLVDATVKTRGAARSTAWVRADENKA